jgi:NAD-dependent dihydropyrimidine dehydrogenase PreA subunit
VLTICKPVQITGAAHVCLSQQCHYLSTVPIRPNSCIAQCRLFASRYTFPVLHVCVSQQHHYLSTVPIRPDSCLAQCRLFASRYTFPVPGAAHVCVFQQHHYLSTVPINPFTPSPTHSTADSQSFRFSVQICSRSFLAVASKPPVCSPGLARYWFHALLRVSMRTRR